MRMLTLLLLSTVIGCRARIASPQFQRRPQVVCIVLVDANNRELAHAAIEACEDAIQGKGVKP